MSSNSLSCIASHSTCFSSPKLNDVTPFHFQVHIQKNSISYPYLNAKEVRNLFKLSAKKRRNSDRMEFAKSKKREENFLPEFDQLSKDDMDDFLDLQLQSEVETDFTIPDYRHYEILFLIGQNNLDEVEDIVERYKGVIGGFKGRIWRLNDWGVRLLAYKVKKNDYANYILMNFEIPADKINELDVMMEKDEKVIRHLISKQKAAITKDCPSPENFFAVSEEEFEEEFGGEEEEEEEEFEEEGEEEGEGEYGGDEKEKEMSVK